MVEPRRRFDVVVLGQGLAGSAVAWQLRRYGQHALLIDADEPVTASRVAAGLITPITGKRYVRAEDFEPHWLAAGEFYSAIEEQCRANFFESVPIVRLFAGPEDREFFLTKRLERHRNNIRLLEPAEAVDGGFEMHGARLRVAEFLKVTREAFQTLGQFLIARIDPKRDVQIEDNGIRIPKLNIAAGGIVCCLGHWQWGADWFPGIPDSPCRGDVLRLKIEGYEEHRVRNRGIWIAPELDGTYLAGSTYDWNLLENRPTESGRRRIVTQVEDITGCRVEVLSHLAAVRPAMKSARPVVQFSKSHPRIAVLNGLGARGALWAPLQAEQLVRRLTAAGEPS